MKRGASSAIYGTIIALCLVFAGLALQMEQWKARLLPLLVSSSVMALALIAVIKENLQPAKDGEPSSVREAALGQYVVSGAWVLGFVIAVYCFGFLAAIALYCLSYAKVYGASWAQALLLAIITPLFVHIVFDLLLGVELYHGLLFSQ